MARILQKNTAIYMTLALGALFGVLFLRFHKEKYDASELIQKQEQEKKTVVYGGTVPVTVTIADTPKSREQGLSHTPRLPKHSGKLFIFDKPDLYGFWMKDMGYPIDIIWIDSDFTIVDIATNIAPETYPNIIYPRTPVRYALEMNAHEALSNGFTIGTQVEFNQ